MTAPTVHPVTLNPPYPGMTDNSNQTYKFLYELWKRTGDFNSSVANLTGLESSVKELNMLVGVSTGITVQQQIDSKANISALGTMASQNANNVTITGGSLAGTTITGSVINSSAITIPAGSLNLVLNGVVTSNATPVGNVGAGEDTLITYAFPANTLSGTHQFIEIEAWGTIAANANNKRIKLKIGTTTLYDTTAVAANAGSWLLKSKVIRTTATTQQVISQISSDNSLIVNGANYVDATEDLSTSLAIFCTGEATANDDIVQKGLIVKWFDV